MRVTPLNVFLWVALVASLAVNAVVLWRHDAPVAAKAPPARSTTVLPKAGPDPARELRACEDRLKARQARDALRSLAAGLRASRESKPEEPGDNRDRGDLLCRISEKQMRDRWREKEKETLANVRESLADAEEVESNAVKDAARIAKSLDLSPADTDRFAERFRPLRIESVGALSAALGKDPVDYTAAQDAVRKNFGEELRLLAELFGDATSERYAADAEEGELTVLAIIAAMSGGELPDSVF